MVIENGQRSPSTVEINIARRGSYSADIFSRASFADPKRRDELGEIAVNLVVASGLWSESTAVQVVDAGMRAESRQNASMILIRKTDDPLGKYIGLSWQEMVTIPTTEGGDIKLLYYRLRAFKKGHRRIHLGRYSARLARAAYIESEPTHFAHRTGSPAAAESFIQAGMHKPGELSPWESTYDTNKLRQELLMGVFFRYRTNGKEVNMSTGVSIGDYLEPNGAYEPDFTHTRTMVLKERMEKEFGMVSERRDALWVVGQYT